MQVSIYTKIFAFQNLHSQILANKILYLFQHQILVLLYQAEYFILL